MAPTSYADWCLNRIATAVEAAATALEVLVMAQQMARQEPAAEPGTSLPDDLPGREALEAAGISSMEKLPRKGGELERLGLDGQMVSRILTWLRVNG
jgi:hypothetical protein